MGNVVSYTCLTNGILLFSIYEKSLRKKYKMSTIKHAFQSFLVESRTRYYGETIIVDNEKERNVKCTPFIPSVQQSHDKQVAVHLMYTPYVHTFVHRTKSRYQCQHFTSYNTKGGWHHHCMKPAVGFNNNYSFYIYMKVYTCVHLDRIKLHFTLIFLLLVSQVLSVVHVSLQHYDTPNETIWTSKRNIEANIISQLMII